MTAPKIAVAPDDDGIVEAVVRGGGRPAPPDVADGLIWTDPFDPQGLRKTLASSPVRWVQLPFAGIDRFLEADVIDEQRVWTCTKGVYGYACAEHALALMLAAARRVHERVRERSWRVEGRAPERMLRGETIVVVGTGGIGRELIGLLRPLRVRALAVNRSGTPLGGAERTLTHEALPEVVAEAGFLVLAASLTPATRHMIDAGIFERMREDAWVVNVARGALIDTPALVEALTEGKIGGAALDVTDPEPLPEDHPLWSLDDVIITPHVANTWRMATPELRAMVQRNVSKFRDGKPLEGLIDPELGY